MLTMLGSKRRCCDGITRRETLKVGALSALGGFGLPHFLRASEAGATFEGRANSVIVLYLLGGAPTQDMYDLKPNAPKEIGGEFKPIPTSAPGIEICELLPKSARWMHRSAVVRTVSPQMTAKRVSTDRPDELYDSKVREVLLDVDASGGEAELIVGLRVDVLFSGEVWPESRSVAPDELRSIVP